MPSDAMAQFVAKYKITFTVEAFTDRTGDDTSPMTLRKEQVAWATLPPVGAIVKAHGNGGWTYWGVVIEHATDGEHYTIRVTSAANRKADNFRLWHTQEAQR